jgi:error-prone DNA polymerase
MTAFAELVAATNFSFLEGASFGEDMIAQAVALGHAGIGIADRNTVAGVVRAHKALRLIRLRAVEGGFPDIDFKLAVGARLVFVDGTPDIVAYPTTRHGWGRLTRLLTSGNLRAQKGDCILGFGDLLRHLDDLLLIVLTASSARPQQARGQAMLPPLRSDPSVAETLRRLAAAAPDRIWLGVTMPRSGRDRRRLKYHVRLAQAAGVPLLATCDALYAERSDRPLHDVLNCIRGGTTIHSAGRKLAAHGERHLKSGDEMARLFANTPQAVEQSLQVLQRIDFALTDLAYEYPHEPVPEGWEPQGWLEHITYAAARARFPDGIPARMQKLLGEELSLIADRRYAYYFLTVHDIVRFAREECKPAILCQGRGSAANSAVCWLLGVTSVDPMRYDLLFSRFISAERDEPPDIDIDFEHERREEVMQYIYRRYGRHRAAIAATVIHYRPRSAVREVGKALGLSQDVTQRLTSTVWGSFADRFETKHLGESGFTLDNPEIARLHSVVDTLLKFPRHLSQHVGGYVLTHGRLDETVPIHHGAMEDRTFIEWDKDDIDELKIMKVDILALGMLTCIRKAFDLMEQHGLGDHALETIANDDHPHVYDMLCKGDSIGVFQVESRAQINMLPRLKPRKLYDLVVQVAIVRPGPIEGDMVHPYLRRRAGKEQPEYPSPAPPHDPDELRNLLKETYGVPLFQEQAMKLAMVAAAFTPAEANQLRRAMATFRKVGGMDNFEEKLIGGMVRRGYQRDFAERCYKQIEGFGSYGFPESHALSFARLVYVSAWIKCFHPAVFGCAILNSQPMGFYAPAQLVQDAREHGVVVRPIDVNASAWDNALERLDDGSLGIRLGFRQVDGFRQTWADELVAARDAVPFATVEAVAARAGLPTRGLNLLADADAFGSIDMARREALWEVRRTPPRQLSLFAAAGASELGEEHDAKLPEMPASEQVAADYQTTRLSLKDHPMRFLRPLFAAEGVISSAQAVRTKDGRRARIAGVVLVRQRPGKGNAIFVTIEDETGITNALMWARDFEANRRAVMAARLLVLEGVIQRSEEGVIHLMTVKAYDRTAELRRLSSDYDSRTPLLPVDEVLRPKPNSSQDTRAGHPRDVRVLPPSRDFH